jgi:thiol-disulfide isomerase/thioredoxin
LFTIASYPFAYENINFVYHKSDDEKILVEGDFDFSIKDRLGKTIKLSELKNKIVCIDMWSSTCGGCIRSMPEFEKLNIYFKTNQDYRIISLFCPMKEHETYEWFLNYIKQDFNYNIDYYYIEVDEFKKLGIYQFPEFFLINKDNKIVYRGLITYKKTIKDNIYEMLEKINSNE